MNSLTLSGIIAVVTALICTAIRTALTSLDHGNGSSGIGMNPMCATATWSSNETSCSWHNTAATSSTPLVLAPLAPPVSRQLPDTTAFETASSSYCDLWLAPSTIPGAGLGVFTGRDFYVGEVVTTGDVTVPLVDMDTEDDTSSSSSLAFLWDDYTWHASSFTGMALAEGRSVHGASFGIGALPNCLFSHINVDESGTAFDTAGVHRSQPGAGAFSPYHDRRGLATRHIQAAQEVFVDYGYEYFEGSRQETIGYIPFVEHYAAADQVIAKMVGLQNTIEQQQHANHDLSFWNDLYQFISTNITTIWHTSRVLHALPQRQNYTHDVLPLIQLGKGTATAHDSTRSLEWLEQHGVCLGALEIKTSQLRQAGRGVFVRQAYAEGQIVAAVPLLHIPDRAVLDMTPMDDDGEKEPSSNPSTGFNNTDTKGTKRHHRQQLLLNYCFGHEQSTLLLCPYGIASSVINHSSKHANLRIQWNQQLSNAELLTNWIHLPLPQWASHLSRAGPLVFEYIATTELAPGDELYLDYGDAWEQAWNTHVQQWLPPAALYPSGLERNNDVTSRLPTVTEQPTLFNDNQNVQVYCHEAYRRISGWDEADEDLHRCRILRRRRHHHHNSSGAEEDYLYMAVVVKRYSLKHHQSFEAVTELLWDLPRDAFFFEDVMYTRDHAQAWAFRHEMMIPDHIMPEAWKNVQQ
jgi:hypothetical protein